MVLRSLSTRVLLAVVFASLTACKASPITKPIEGGPVATGAGSLTQARKFLEGRWSLESFEVHPPGKAGRHLEGPGNADL